MICPRTGKFCQHTGCNTEYRLCGNSTTEEQLQEQIKKLEREIQFLRTENQNLRNRLMAASPYTPY